MTVPFLFLFIMSVELFALPVWSIQNLFYEEKSFFFSFCELFKIGYDRKKIAPLRSSSCVVLVSVNGPSNVHKLTMVLFLAFVLADITKNI